MDFPQEKPNPANAFHYVQFPSKESSLASSWTPLARLHEGRGQTGGCALVLAETGTRWGLNRLTRYTSDARQSP
jgi:hypothetical protein